MTLPLCTSATVAFAMGAPSGSVTVPCTLTACRRVEKAARAHNKARRRHGRETKVIFPPFPSERGEGACDGAPARANRTGLLTCASLLLDCGEPDSAAFPKPKLQWLVAGLLLRLIT